MSNTIEIACQVGTTDVSTPLGLEIWVNDSKFVDIDHVVNEQKIAFNIDDNESEHNLRFVMKNKTSEHTKIDADGNILSDARLVISNLSFDEIPLGQLTSDCAVYTHNFNGTGPETQDKFYGEMGCNGTVSLKFTTPIYLWLLEHM